LKLILYKSLTILKFNKIKSFTIYDYKITTRCGLIKIQVIKLEEEMIQNLPINLNVEDQEQVDRARGRSIER
jgi:hypothetical protein